MTNQQGAPEALRPIARYKIGYATDGWGMRSSTPSGIPHHAGAWVRYEDHVAALVEAQQPAPSAAAAVTQQAEETAWLRENDAPQPYPTPQADSQPAPVAAFEVADAIADSQYLAGVSAGWNAANADDPNAALQKLHESRAGYLKPLRAARAPADSVTAPAVDEDGERYRHLIETLDDQPHGKPTLGAAWDDDIGFWTKGSFFGLKDKASIDAAIDAERAQGNTL